MVKSTGLLSLLAFSEIRKQIILLLYQKPKTLAEIKERFDLTSPVVIPELRKMEEKNLIHKENDKYHLTEMGEAITERFLELYRTLRIFEENERFWKEHDLSGIPKKFLMRIHELGNYKILLSTPTEIYKPHNEYIKCLRKSKWIKGVSPILHRDYPKYFATLAENGVDISLVINRDVFEKIKKEHRKELQKYLNCRNSRLQIFDGEIKVAFTVADNFLSLGLFSAGTKIYDLHSDLVSREPTAIKWGENLFRYYERRSEKVVLNDL